MNECPGNKGNPKRRHQADQSIITRGVLTQLWQEKQGRAIEIIHNDCHKPSSSHCEIAKEKVFDHFSARCKRVLTKINPPPWKDKLHIPPPEWTPDVTGFSVDEVEAIISSLPSHRSPGADGVCYDYVKRRKRTLAPVFTAIMNICAMNRRVPSDWKHSIITLVPKKNGNPNNIEDWRPISLLCTSYKIYMKLIQKKMVPWLVDTHRLSPRQKGSMPRNGLQEHVFTLKTDIDDFLHKSSQMYVGFIDIKDAFGSIDHEMMINEMREVGYPESVLDITSDIYTESTFQVKTANGLTKPITRGKGIIQGCPWSVLIFEQGIDKWLRWIEQAHPSPCHPNPVQGYVDDVDMTATNEEDIQEAMNKTDQFMTYSGMEVKHRKCAILHGQHTGNNWSRHDGTATTHIEVQNAPVPMAGRDTSYTYLGHDINLSGTSESDQVEKIITEFRGTMEKIDIAPLPVAAKLQAVNTMATSKLNFYFSNNKFTEKRLDELEDIIVFYTRAWLGLNKSSTRSFMFTPRDQGGLGLFNPRINYHAKKLSFYLSVLNSDDEQTRASARESLRLHMTKRKCQQSRDPENNFAGYSTNANKKVIKASKVTWRRSQWIHLNELCSRLSVQLHLRGEEYVFLVTSDGIQLSFTDGRAFYTSFKHLQLDRMLSLWREKEFQGRIARTENVDRKVSSPHLCNLKLSDTLVKFVVKARLQLIECNVVMHTYYPTEYNRECDRCGFHSDTLSHILNGCPESSDAIKSRHNRVMNIVARVVSEANGTSRVSVDSLVRPSMFIDTEQDFDGIHHNRPDICIVDSGSKTCMLVEVAIPFDPFINDCYQSKFDRYMPLCQRVSDLGYSCKIVVLIIGSVGNVHNKFVNGLCMLGLSMTRAKATARYCAVSVMIGSRKIWKQRCKQILP